MEQSTGAVGFGVNMWLRFE